MVNYIMNLRSHVGKIPLIQCGACVFIEKDNRVLLQRRVDNDKWGIPGGALELGESLEEAAVREVLEETGLLVNEEDLEFLGLYSDKELHYIYPNGDEVYNVVSAFKTKKFYSNFKHQEEETKEFKFFDKYNIPANLNPPDISIIKDFFRKFNK